jgi:tRNA(Met) C34 N-acetyltransferase TmcA
MRKKVDSRIRTLVENCVKLRQRSMFVIIGDKGRDQVVNLHYLLSKASVKARPSVLWCYKKELLLSRSAAQGTSDAAQRVQSVVMLIPSVAAATGCSPV